MTDNTDNTDKPTQRFSVPQDMVVYYLHLLKRGPLWTDEETPEITRLQTAHLAHIQQLRALGKILAVGPILDDGDLRGTAILRVASQEEAQLLAAADPAVQAGRFIFELHPWMTYKGIFPE